MPAKMSLIDQAAVMPAPNLMFEFKLRHQGWNSAHDFHSNSKAENAGVQKAHR
jgi:hypothetical protein